MKYTLGATKLRAKRRANSINPLRDGSEKTKTFLVERGQPSHARYKTWQLVACGWSAKKESPRIFRARHVAGERFA